MRGKRSFLPTLEEIEALERQLATMDAPLDEDTRRKIEAYSKSLRRHGRTLRFVPMLGALSTLLVETSAPWWSTALAAVLFAGAGWLFGERLALVRYRQLLERELPPPAPPLSLTAAGTSGPTTVSALSPPRDPAANAQSEDPPAIE